MADADLARNIVGIIGNVISFFLFLSPALQVSSSHNLWLEIVCKFVKNLLPTFYTIWKAKSVQSFKPDPYLATVLNCAVWVFYGMPFVHPDSLLVVTINGTGLVIEAIYITIFFVYSNWGKRRKIMMFLLVEFAFFGVLVFCTMMFLHGTKQRSMLIGLVAIVFNVLMYASPLTVMKRVIETKSVKYMPFYLSLANFLNGLVWFSYAFIKLDVYILVPNGLGALSGAVQLILYATYYRTTNWDEEEDDKTKSGVELQNAA